MQLKYNLQDGSTKQELSAWNVCHCTAVDGVAWYAVHGSSHQQVLCHLKPVDQADMAKQRLIQTFSMRNFETVFKLCPGANKFQSPSFETYRISHRFYFQSHIHLERIHHKMFGKFNLYLLWIIKGSLPVLVLTCKILTIVNYISYVSKFIVFLNQLVEGMQT